KDDVVSQVSPSPPHPTSSPDWSGALVDQGGSEWQIDVEEHVVVTLAFKNTGSKIWTRDGTNSVSLYATDGSTALSSPPKGGSKERKSLFKDFHWLSATRAVKLKEARVMPGEIGHFLLELRAPRAPGSYQETFSLAAAGTTPTWIKGASVILPIRVPLTSEFIATAPPDQEMTGVKVEGKYTAILLLRSARELSLPGDRRESITVGFKNTGAEIWHSRGVRLNGTTSVRDESWINPTDAARVQGATKPGEIGFVTFQLKAPARRGTYTASFQLSVGDQPVEGGEFDIPITVTADGAGATMNSQPSTTNRMETIPLGGDFSALPAEPMIRVGLYKTTDDQTMVRAKYAPASVMQNGSALCRLALGQLVIVRFDRANRVYKIFGDGSCVGQSTEPYVVRADDGTSPLEIADFHRPVAWLPGADDNTFRGTLELRYAPSTNNIWVINELPLERYLGGIAETSDISPYEYQKALLSAARTYAVYHLQKTRKHAAEFFTVDATYDQVYRGYGAEARSPSIVSAVESTRGQIVTYQEQLAITPYYSRSDGRTRAWTEVWGGGPFPWLVSVPVPWDQGRTLWGHGVGMSATGALGMAKDGKKYDEILRYFYQSTELHRVYK
ncbi:MAG: SpoIID/LytB domain-containing protein, partial [Candidatus Uhrbacteria bacterium]|nr:SpoIID/LytB domain-containing protein [Candidatus Uhrbacteria bacterium]